jgi:hypothetical protein
VIVASLSLPLRAAGEEKKAKGNAKAGNAVAAPATASDVTPPPSSAIPEAVTGRFEAIEKRLAEKDAELHQLRNALEQESAARVNAEKVAADKAAAERALADRLTAEKAAAEKAAAEKAATEPKPAVVTGFVQFDLPFRQSSEDQLNDSTGEPLNEDRFLLRRARLRVEGGYGLVSGAFELDANTLRGMQVRPIGLEGSIRWPGSTPAPIAMATIGMFKVPFGYEVLQSDKDRVFLERGALARALFPGEYDLGARIQGSWRFLRYAVAVMNGEPIGERTFPGRDPNAAKDLVGRVGVDTEIVSGVRVSGGFSALKGTGFSKGSPETKAQLVWVDLNEDGAVNPSETQVIPGSAMVPSQNFKRSAFGLDLQLRFNVPRLGETTVYGELAFASNLDRAIVVADPVRAGRDLRERGFNVAVTQALGQFGIVGVRYDSYNPDADATDRRVGNVVPNDQSFSTLAITAGLRHPRGRLLVEYDYNRNHLGRDLTGKPTNLKDNVFTLRGEVSF